jgi:hypothetical protein
MKIDKMKEMIETQEPEDDRVIVLNKRNEIIAKLYKNMPKEEAKETIILLNQLQKLSSKLNLT